MKRCCESCRFFQTAGFAGSGWCRHPQRLEATSDLILVRASSLGCRKGWAHDLWELGTTPNDNQGTITIGPLRPATEDELAAIVASSETTKPAAPKASSQQVTATDGAGQDLVVGAAPSPHLFRPRIVPAVEHPAQDADQPVGADAADCAAASLDSQSDQRASILRAREIQRARLANRIRPMVSPLDTATSDPGSVLPSPTRARPAVAAELSGDVHDDSRASGAFATPDDGTDTFVPRPTLVPVPPVPEAELRPGQLHAEADVAGGESRFETVPARDPHFVLPIRQPRHGGRVVASDWHDEPQDADVTAEGVLPPLQGEPVEVAERNQISDLADEPPGQDHEEDWYPKPVADRERPRLRRPGFSFRFRRHSPPSRFEDDLRFVGADALEETIRYDEVDWAKDVGHLASADAQGIWSTEETVSQDDGQARGWSLRDGSEDEPPLALVEPTPPEVRNDDGWDVVAVDDNNAIGWTGPIRFDSGVNDYVIAPDVPRLCRTCRDFRPADGGERGWCTSRWAFEHRRMVSAWEMPCESALGSWWLPNDAVWAEEYTEHHDDPTPLLDSLMTSRGPDPRRRASGRRRRR